MNPVFHIVQIFYWLALATWFGGVLFITVAAPVIFRTIQESDPTLPMVLSVNLEGQHGTLLAGSIVANLLTTLSQIQRICAGVLVICFIAQWVLLPTQYGLSALRTLLGLISMILMVYDWRVVSPKIYKHRQEYIDHADELEIANAAKQQFDHYHRESVTVLMLELGALLGLILFSAGISTAQSYVM